MGPFSAERPDAWGFHLGSRIAASVEGPAQPTGVLARGAPALGEIMLEALSREGLCTCALPARRLDPVALGVVANHLREGSREAMLLVRPPRNGPEESMAFGIELAMNAAAHGVSFRVTGPAEGPEQVVAQAVNDGIELVVTMLKEGEL
ncbi:MAG: hypothetical protein JRH11_02175 [Deltaproteobacteria bacterium]|nr:hypothetical protein [Deltaproteobacteria bacterium]